MIDIENYYLDINSIFVLDKERSDRILDIYYQLMASIRDKEKQISETYFNTLIKAGYLKNKKEEDRNNKIKQING